MRATSFGEISDVCLENGVDAQIMQAGKTGTSSLHLTVEPTAMFAAVNEAGRRLRKHPYRRLAEKAFPETVRDMIPPDDIAAQSFVRIINDSVSPQRGEAGMAFTSGLCGVYGTCAEAEPGFAATLGYLLTRNRHPNPEVHAYEILMGEDEQPCFLRKGVGEQSALSLQPLVINGITYPSGSIIKYDLRRDRKQHHGVPLERFDTTPLGVYRARPLISERMRVAPTDEVERINFLRLSVFAFPAGSKRKRMFSRELATSELTREEISLQWSLSIENIAEIAQQEVARHKIH